MVVVVAAAVAMLVVTKIRLAVSSVSSPVIETVEQPLKPNHANQRMNTPTAASVRLWPGIAFTVPVSSIGGRRELTFITEGLEFTQSGEESELKGTKQELLIVIGNRGYSEQIMDAAREAGATGGTVIHANGTGMKRAEKFFGISLASERELILIVSATGKKNMIMQTVMKKAGLETDAKAVVFSLPVTDTAGLRLLEPEENDEEPETPANAESKEA